MIFCREKATASDFDTKYQTYVCKCALRDARMQSMEEKHFDGWIKLKSDLHRVGRLPTIKEGEVWWCAVGENVGAEINGKNSVFSRPVLVFRKLSRYGFMAIPLTSKPHSGSWYANFNFQGKKQIAALAHARVISAARLYTKIGRIDDTDMTVICEAFRALYLPKRSKKIFP